MNNQSNRNERIKEFIDSLASSDRLDQLSGQDYDVTGGSVMTNSTDDCSVNGTCDNATQCSLTINSQCTNWFGECVGADNKVTCKVKNPPSVTDQSCFSTNMNPPSCK